MEITFISPYVNGKINPIPSLGIGYLLSSLRTKGHSYRYIDGQISSKEFFWKEVNKIETPIVGLSSFLCDINELINVAKHIAKRYPDKIIIVGGRGPCSLPPEYLFKKAPIDYIVLGEGEESLPLLLNYLESEKLKLEDISGLAYKKDETITITGHFRYIENLDSLPFPDRETIRQKEYLKIQEDVVGKPMIRLITSRGCYHRCTFCANNSTKYRLRTSANIVEEINSLVDIYKIKNFFFCDAIFMSPKSRLKELCNQIINQDLKLNWKAHARVDEIDFETLKLISEAGCNQLFFGVESGSDKILKILKKGTTQEQTIEAFELCKKIGISTFAYFLVGVPGETDEDIKATVDIINRIQPDGLDVYILLPYPGSSIFNEYCKDKSFFNWDKYLGWKEDNFEKSQRKFLNYGAQLNPVKIRKNLLKEYKCLQKNKNFFLRTYK